MYKVQKCLYQGQKQVEQKTLYLTLHIRNYNSLNLCLYLSVLALLQPAHYYLGHYC